ncbi:MAG: hypothetical protein WC273_05510 [Dehalococcoidia bacterium]
MSTTTKRDAGRRSFAPFRAPAALATFAVLFAAILATAASSVHAQVPPAPTGTPVRTSELAPIESVEIQVLKSLPPQYQVLVVSGLPSGCAAFESISAQRTGTRIDVTVRNTLTVPPSGACTTIYGYAQNVVNIGPDFQPGTTYTVVVNEGAPRSITKTFTTASVAPAPGGTPAPVPPPIATPPVAAPPVTTPIAPLPANVGTGGVVHSGARVEALDAFVGGGAVATAALLLAMLIAVRVPRRREH